MLVLQHVRDRAPMQIGPYAEELRARFSPLADDDSDVERNDDECGDGERSDGECDDRE
ncbi:MAG: hypothetical protein R3B09_17450 [Nannocystaceae bacterium]